MVDCTTVIPKIFLIGALLGAIGCLSKADYNLPVFLFAYIAWNYLRDQKIRVVLLFIISIIIDAIWLFFIAWGSWASEDYHKLAEWETGLHHAVVWVTFINLALKIICIVLSIIYEPSIKQGISQKNYLGAQQQSSTQPLGY